MSDVTSADEYFRAGFRLLGCGRNDRVVELVQEALREFSNDGSLWELLGVGLYRLENLTAAIHALETASLLKPLDTGARLYLAMAYAARGKQDLAVFVYLLIGDSPRTPIWMLPRVARQLGELERFSDALHVCRTIVARAPERHEAHFGIAYYLHRLGADRSQVISSVSRANELAPDKPLYQAVLASLVHSESGKTRARSNKPPFELDHGARMIWSDFSKVVSDRDPPG
jgi:tetratricopeptide (TPR) repeat protein